MSSLNHYLAKVKCFLDTFFLPFKEEANLRIGEIPCFRQLVWVRPGPSGCERTRTVSYRMNTTRFRVPKSRVRTLGSSWMTKSVYFRRARTFQFLTRDLITLNSILSISHRPRPLAPGRSGPEPHKMTKTWNLSSI